MNTQLFILQEKLHKALAHSRRLEIIQLLRENELSVSDIYSMLDLPQANVSQHLQILRDADILSTRKDGKQIFYKIKESKVITVCDLVKQLCIENNLHLFSSHDLNSELVHDPVCHMELSARTASFVYRHDNSLFYFCASGCLQSFKKEPEKYVR